MNTDNNIDITSSLTFLIDKYKNEADKICGKNENNIFENFFHAVDKNIAYNWLNDIFSSKTVKCKDKAKQFRDEGNMYYKTKNYKFALRCYTDSVNYAPYDSEEFSLALANRSAVLYATEDYKNCILDIKRCLDYSYPNNLKHKIYLRLAHCYQKLHLFSDVEETVKCLQNHITNDVLNLEQNKLDALIQDVALIENEILQNTNLSETSERCNNVNSFNLPKLAYGQNENFLFASKALELKYNIVKGRYVIANENIKMGDVIFVEKPFSFVPIWKSNEDSECEQKCYNCYKVSKFPLPCKNCLTSFCSKQCQNESWEKYHRWECIGSCIDIWTRIGVNFLALRMLLLGSCTGFNNILNQSQTNIEQFGNLDNNYPYICSLVTNVEQMDKTDILPHAVSSMMIILYLKEKTDFFHYLRTNYASSFAEMHDNELILKLGGILLKHILQVIANASTIEAVHEGFYEKFNSAIQTSDPGIYVDGVGLYPSVSMMNHSCDPNITNYFCDDYIIVTTNRDIVKGDEIFNSYGYDWRKHSTEERQSNLKRQHYFTCTCTACTSPTKPEIFHKGLRCRECSGCALDINPDRHQCLTCGHSFSSNNHFLYIVKADELYERYEREENVEHLKKCLQLREKVYYQYNYEIYTVNLDLQMYYGETGNFNKWWYYTQKTLELDKHLMGEFSLRYAMNLRFAILIIIPYICDFSIEEKNKISQQKLESLVAKVDEIFTTIQRIFKLFYREYKINFKKIRQMQHDMIERSNCIVANNLFDNSVEEQ